MAKLSYEEASANLNKGGLSGSALSDAQANLKASYGSGATPGASDSATTPVENGTGNNAFIAELQKSLLAQSGMISSADSKIEGSINEAIGGIEKANAATTARLESEYSRNRGYAMDQNANSEQAFLENRNGYATPVVAFANLREYNAKTIRDLDQRKNEAILQGDALAAGKIAELQLEKMKFEQEAAQRTFTNLMSTGNFALGVQAGERADKAQTFQENQAMSAIALEYGIKLEENDTFDSLVTRAMPVASEAQKLKLDQIRASIASSNASTQAALASAAASSRANRPLDAATVAALATASRNGVDVSGFIEDASDFGRVLSETNQLEQGEVSSYFKARAREGVPFQKAIEMAKEDPAIRISNFNAAQSIAADIYSKPGAVPRKQDSVDAMDSWNRFIMPLFGERPRF